MALEQQDDWSIDKARTHYNLPYWSEGYFDLNEQGNLVVKPDRNQIGRAHV